MSNNERPNFNPSGYTPMPQRVTQEQLAAAERTRQYHWERMQRLLSRAGLRDGPISALPVDRERA